MTASGSEKFSSIQKLIIYCSGLSVLNELIQSRNLCRYEIITDNFYSITFSSVKYHYGLITARPRIFRAFKSSNAVFASSREYRFEIIGFIVPSLARLNSSTMSL